MSSSKSVAKVFNTLYNNYSHTSNRIVINKNGCLPNKLYYSSCVNKFACKSNKMSYSQSTTRCFSQKPDTVKSSSSSPAPSSSSSSDSEPVITKDSWAAERLEKKGEKIPEGKNEPLILTDAYMNNPSPKIKKLSLEILELNMIEINALMHVLMVSVSVDYVRFITHDCIFLSIS